MTSSLYPYLFATLGDAVERLPDDLAKALETTLGSTMRAHADEGITLLSCLQRIRHVDAADGQPWPDKGRKQCFGFAMARIDRANPCPRLRDWRRTARSCLLPSASPVSSPSPAPRHARQ